jgi:signal peptidase II
MEDAMTESQPHLTTQPSRRPVRRLFVLLAAVVVALDQLTKYLIVREMALGQSTPVLGKALSFTYTHNTGSAMGLLPAGGPVLAIIAGIFVIAILLWGHRWVGRNPWLIWGLGALLGGAIGNLLDRARLGYVDDFIDVHFWPVFNVADIAVCCGAGAILIGTLLYNERRDACSTVPGTDCSLPPREE